MAGDFFLNGVATPVNKGYDKSMKTTTVKYAEIITEVLMEDENREECHPLSSKPDTVLVCSGGRLRGKGWLVSTVIRENPRSLSISVQLPGGRGGFATDILNRFLDEETVREYAEHALTTILENEAAKVKR
jgi:hypothetical protein